MSDLPRLGNFRNYIQQTQTLMKTLKLGTLPLKVAPLDPTSSVSAMVTSYLRPVFTLMGKVRQYMR